MNTADSQYYTIAAKEVKRSISAMFSYIPGKTGRDSKTLIKKYWLALDEPKEYWPKSIYRWRYVKLHGEGITLGQYSSRHQAF